MTHIESKVRPYIQASEQGKVRIRQNLRKFLEQRGVNADQIVAELEKFDVMVEASKKLFAL